MSRVVQLSTIFLTTFLFLFTIVIFLHPITAINQDLGRHLKLGEIIVQTKSIPSTNLFSYTEPDHPFTNHHWGSEVIYYFVQKWFGWNGLLFMNVLGALGEFGMVFYLAVKRSSLWAAAVVGAVYAPILLERTNVRPEVWGYLLGAVLLWILDKTDRSNKTHKTNMIGVGIAVAMVMILWVNVHISFIFGVVLVGFWVVDRLFLKGEKRGVILCGVIAVLATLINPHGIAGVLAPFSIFQNYGYMIAENQNIFYLWQMTRNVQIWYFLLAVGVLTISLIRQIRHIRIFDWLTAGFFTVLAFSAIRHFPFFVLVTLPIAAVGVEKFVEREKKEEKDKKDKIKIVFILMATLWLGWVWMVHSPQIGTGLVRGYSGAVDFVEQQGITGPIFNNFDNGSYLIYRLYPKERVFVDGRPEAYSRNFFQITYIPMHIDPAVWNEAVETYGIQTIIFAHTDMTQWAHIFLARIVRDPEWKTVYLDETSIVLVKKEKMDKKDQRDQNIVDTYGFSPVDLTLPPDLPTVSKNREAYLSMANFFYKIGRNDMVNWYISQSRFLKE